MEPIHVIELSNLDFKCSMEAAIFVCFFISQCKMFAKFNIRDNFGLSLVRIKLLFQIFQDSFVVTIRNGIKRGDHWTSKSLLNNVLFLMDGPSVHTDMIRKAIIKF